MAKGLSVSACRLDYMCMYAHICDEYIKEDAYLHVKIKRDLYI